MADNDTAEKDFALGGVLALAGTIAFLWGLWTPSAESTDPICPDRPAYTAACHPGRYASGLRMTQRHNETHRNKVILEWGGGAAAMLGGVLVHAAAQDERRAARRR
jgi:hypothetical protein